MENGKATKYTSSFSLVVVVVLVVVVALVLSGFVGMVSTFVGSWNAEAARANRAPPTPTLISPKDCATGVSLTPTLDCSDVTDPDDDSVTYVFWLDDDSDVWNDRVWEESSSSSEKTVPSGKLSTGTTYYWAVYAHDGSAGSGLSSTWSFTTENIQALPTPTLISPYSQARYVPTQPRLICSEVTDPDEGTVTYVFSLDDNRDFSSPLINELSLTKNVLQIDSDWGGSLSSDTAYYWKVYAHDDGGHASDWSSTWSFEVKSSTNYFDDIKVGVRDTYWGGMSNAGCTDKEVRNAVYSAFADVDKVFCTLNDLPCWYEVSNICKFTGGAVDEVKSYRNHGYDLVVLYSDEQVGGGYYGENYYVISCTYCNGIHSIYNTDGLVHELGHYRGCPDLYILEVPSEQNAVASESHTPSTNDQYLMDYPYGIRTFCDYSKDIAKATGSDTRVQDSDKPYCDSRRYFAPTKNFILVKDNDGDPILGASVGVYCNTPYKNLDGTTTCTSCIENSVDASGTTDSTGRFLFTQKKKNEEKLDLAFDIVFVRVEYQGNTEYAWIEDVDVGGLYWGYKVDPILVRDGSNFDIYYTKTLPC